MELIGWKLFAVLTSVLAKDYSGGHIPFYFNSYPNALSTVSDVYTTLYSKPQPGQQSGAQFPYTKIANSTDYVGLAKVYLIGNKRKYLLQSNFAPIPQQCSCYWIDAASLAKRSKTISSGTYQILIKEKVRKGSVGYRQESGYFNLVFTRNNRSAPRTRKASKRLP